MNLETVKLPAKDDKGFSKSDRQILISIYETGISRIDEVHQVGVGKTRNKLLFEYLCGVLQTLKSTNHPLYEYMARLMVFIFQVRDPYTEAQEMIKEHKKHLN